MRLTYLTALLFVACGGNSNHHLADSGADAFSQDTVLGDTPPQGGVVTVVVTLDGAPSSGVQVYFQNADSSLVAAGSALTDSNGSASATMVPGGFVTVLEPQDNGDAVRSFVRPPAGFSVDGGTVDTFAAVKPGDVIHVDVGEGNTSFVSSNITLTVPTDPNDVVTQYELFASCSIDGPDEPIDITPAGSGSGTPEGKARRAGRPGDVLDNAPVAVTDLGNCANGSADMLVVTLDANGDIEDFIYAPGVQVGSATGSDSVPVTIAGSYAAVPTITDTLTDLPANNTSDITLEVALSTVNGAIVDAESDATPVNGSASFALQVATIPNGLAETEFQVGPGSGVVDEQAVIDWAASPAVASSLDYQQNQIKDITAEPAFDVAAQAVDWPIGTVGNDPSLIFTELDIDRTSGSGSDETEVDYDWQLIGPPTYAGSAVLPTLPTDVFAFNPVATDTVTLPAVLELSVPGGYDAVRAIFLQNDSFENFIASMASGQIIEEFVEDNVDDVVRHGRRHVASRARVSHAAAHGRFLAKLLPELARRHVAPR